MNNDLISRNDLEKFKILPFDNASYDDTEINAAYQNGWNDAIDRIVDNAPTVKAEKAKESERPQGEWLVVGHDDTTYWYRCSNCEYEEHDNFTKHYRFCPHCGADMKGGAE